MYIAAVAASTPEPFEFRILLPISDYFLLSVATVCFI